MSINRVWWMAALTLTACNGIPDPRPVQDRVALEAFADCEALELYIEDTAVLDMRAQLDRLKDQETGWGVLGGMRSVDMAESAPSSAGAAQNDAAGPDAYTTTNTQVSGVDEADFVKNDGTRIFVLSGNTLYLNRSWPADQLTRVSSMQIEGHPSEMFLDEDDHIIVFSSVAFAYPLADQQVRGCMEWDCGYNYGNTTKVTQIDVSDLEHPSVSRVDYLPGNYVNARRMGRSVRLVLNDPFRWPSGVRFWPDYMDEVLYDDQALFEQTVDRMAKENEVLIREQTLDDWVPKARRQVADGPSFEVGYECTNFRASSAPERLGYVTVATFDLDDATAPMHQSTILADAGEIYASLQSLYIASNHWWWTSADGQPDHTYLHKFDLIDPAKSEYVASGGVDGRLLDQFSMDEHNGFLRVATTVTTWTESTWDWGSTITNRVTVMAERDNELVEIGRTPDIAPGERIFSARFIGDRGFVVTFLQVDPLFALDLSDPSDPQVKGELKVPGFSTYLHPIGENHLLGIGVHVPETGGQQQSLKLSLFDVSDLENPTLQDDILVGTSSAWSEAQYDHRAFNWFAEKKLLAIPFLDWGDGYSQFTSDLRIFHVDTETGISARGALKMGDVYESQYRWDWYWRPQVRRSVLADDFVYAISDAGIRSAHIDSLQTPLATVRFDQPD